MDKRYKQKFHVMDFLGRKKTHERQPAAPFAVNKLTIADCRFTMADQ
jgi:hypothetical protein